LPILTYGGDDGHGAPDIGALAKNALGESTAIAEPKEQNPHV
jgi:hypothetical protein